jgi:hypothetical protein
MMNFLNTIPTWSKFWITFPILLVCLPVILFGHPPFYGDDFHYLLGFQENGFWGNTWVWLDTYGLAYRPIGIFISNTLFYLFSDNEIVIYWVSLLLYFIVIYNLFLYLEKITKNLAVTVFVTMFFSLFPFNPTAFLQLSSNYMLVVSILTIIFIGEIGVKKNDINLRYLFLLCISWLGLLFIYEQVTGLVAVVVLLMFFLHSHLGLKVAFQKSFLPSVMLGLTTLIFVLVYFFSSGNPKIESIERINQQDEIARVSSNNIVTEQLAKSETIGRIQSIKLKIYKVYSFSSKNIKYAFFSLIEEGFLGVVLLILVCFFSILFLLLPVEPIKRKKALVIFFLGFVWVASTISPFLLYEQIHIPPYTLLIPSIGAALLMIGFFWSVWPSRYYRTAIVVFKINLSILVFFFTLLQYGYYFGLREELSYWKMLSVDIKHVLPQVDAGKIIIIRSIPEKNNQHIFWLEKAVGKRYFKVQFEGKPYKFIFTTDGIFKSITVSSDSTIGETNVYEYKTLKAHQYNS